MLVSKKSDIYKLIATYVDLQSPEYSIRNTCQLTFKLIHALFNCIFFWLVAIVTVFASIVHPIILFIIGDLSFKFYALDNLTPTIVFWVGFLFLFLWALLDLTLSSLEFKRLTNTPSILGNIVYSIKNKVCTKVEFE